MQNRYVGDIGDFGKYGLLRSILKHCERKRLRLGINWYLVEPKKTVEAKNSDGGRIQYLLKPKTYKQYDEKLFDELKSIVRPQKSGAKVVSKGRRDVTAIKRCGVLPKNTVFYSRALDFPASNRDEWLKSGLEALKDCAVVFFDPDNGLTPLKNSNFKYSVPLTWEKSVKYVYHEDLEKYFERGQSLIVYQHRTREKEEKYLLRFKKIKKEIKKAGSVFYISFHKEIRRDYVFILHQRHAKDVQEAAEEFFKSKWNSLFSDIHTI